MSFAVRIKNKEIEGHVSLIQGEDIGVVMRFPDERPLMPLAEPHKFKTLPEALPVKDELNRKTEGGGWEIINLDMPAKKKAKK